MKRTGSRWCPRKVDEICEKEKGTREIKQDERKKKEEMIPKDGEIKECVTSRTPLGHDSSDQLHEHPN